MNANGRPRPGSLYEILLWGEAERLRRREGALDALVVLILAVAGILVLLAAASAFGAAAEPLDASAGRSSAAAPQPPVGPPPCYALRPAPFDHDAAGGADRAAGESRAAGAKAQSHCGGGIAPQEPCRCGADTNLATRGKPAGPTGAAFRVGAPPAVSPSQAPRHPGTQTPVFRVTAYCPCRQCCGRWADGRTASGSRADHPLLAAPAEVPFGTLVIIPGYAGGRPVRVEDRGGAIRGRRLDILMPTHEAAREWGVRYLNVMCEARSAK